jgi:hypothetical protein
VVLERCRQAAVSPDFIIQHSAPLATSAKHRTTNRASKTAVQLTQTSTAEQPTTQTADDTEAAPRKKRKKLSKNKKKQKKRLKLAQASSSSSDEA